ncbi:hypothetical protein DFH09DRAFT_1099801 [Mycena vulgaris]|nr:hypothetical protein DFH09DRAFT_1099801 [Mycena vulgaris]
MQSYKLEIPIRKSKQQTGPPVHADSVSGNFRDVSGGERTSNFIGYSALCQEEDCEDSNKDGGSKRFSRPFSTANSTLTYGVEEGDARCRKEVVDGVQKWRETSASVNEVKRGCWRLEAHWRRRGEEHDAASGHLPCTGREDGGTMVKLHDMSLFTIQTYDRGK